MATHTKKKTAAKSNDTITFKKSELLEKLKIFLKNEDACDGDWLNKVRVEFLGEKVNLVKVCLQYETEVELEMASSGTPTVSEVTAKIQEKLYDGDLNVEIPDWGEFKVVKVKVVP